MFFWQCPNWKRLHYSKLPTTKLHKFWPCLVIWHTVKQIILIISIINYQPQKSHWWLVDTMEQFYILNCFQLIFFAIIWLEHEVGFRKKQAFNCWLPCFGDREQANDDGIDPSDSASIYFGHWNGRPLGFE